MSFHGKDIKLTPKQREFIESLLTFEEYYYNERQQMYQSPKIRGWEILMPNEKRIAKALSDKNIIYLEGRETGTTFYAFFCYDRIIPLLEYWVETAEQKKDDKEWNRLLLLKYHLEDNEKEIF